ncbi:MAG TPA: M23 family metallopeptidase [Rectinemataceae bacterium]|nr:M23 family metallopeptidase [Rectinemataceae bacterium]
MKTLATARSLAALGALAVLLASGAAAGDSAFPYDSGGSGFAPARMGTRVLGPAVASAGMELSGPDAADALRELLLSAREGGLDPGEVLAATLPSPSEVLALLSMDRDVDDFARNAREGGRAGSYYSSELRLAGSVRPRRQSFFSVFDAAYAELGSPPSAGLLDGVRPYDASTGIIGPPVSELVYSHPFALDLFFDRVRNRPDGQEGPVIPSLSDGMVVAASSSWRGGAGLASWESGGLSPSAGNGVVVYDALNKRVFSYFHLRSTSLRVGDLVRAGTVLGVGGNTGVNARRPGHGGHLHVEIFDVAGDRSLGAREILRLVTTK